MLRSLFMLALAIFVAINSGTAQETPTQDPAKETAVHPLNKVLAAEVMAKTEEMEETAAKVTKSSHHLSHDRASKGHGSGSIPGLMSQTDLYRGRDGRDGGNGVDGRDGRDGICGVKGEKGEPGIPGKDGRTSQKGEKGEPGNSCGDSGAKGSSSSGCTASFHLFEKVQDLPTNGTFAVEHFTINGSLFLAFANYHGDIKGYKTSSVIYKMDESTGRFTYFQNLQTIGAIDLEYFSIADKHFLAVAFHYDKPDNSAGIYLLDSAIYQWNGEKFIVFQSLATKGAGGVTFFEINNEKYLTVTNSYDGSTFSTQSYIYKWVEGYFNKTEEIATEGATRCTAFRINGDTFIAFANRYNAQQKFAPMSTVFKWSGTEFVKLQSFQTYGAWDAKSFEINGHTFLAFANYFTGSKYNTNSVIYKWDGIRFVPFQSIPTRGNIALHPFVIGGQTFLGVANYHGDVQKFNTQSVLYQASGARFISYQAISTQGATGMTSFEYKGHTYLAVANRYTGQKYNINSALYKWV